MVSGHPEGRSLRRSSRLSGRRQWGRRPTGDFELPLAGCVGLWLEKKIGSIGGRGQTHWEWGEVQDVSGSEELAGIVMSYNDDVRSWQEGQEAGEAEPGSLPPQTGGIVRRDVGRSGLCYERF